MLEPEVRRGSTQVLARGETRIFQAAFRRSLGPTPETRFTESRMEAQPTWAVV